MKIVNVLMALLAVYVLAGCGTSFKISYVPPIQFGFEFKFAEAKAEAPMPAATQPVKVDIQETPKMETGE